VRIRVSIIGFFLLAASAATTRGQQHIAVWGGAGTGFFARGGSDIRDPDYHKFAAVALSIPGDDVRLRVIYGSLERDEDIPSNTGDNDLDYRGGDVVVTRKATGLPADLALGVSWYEEAYHEGYPDRDRGGRVFVHRWGPHVSIMRDVTFWRFFSLWGEADIHYLPYRPRQVVLLFDAGLGVHF
jgi:hypothetical protein